MLIAAGQLPRRTVNAVGHETVEQVSAGGVRWHVARAGSGPQLLLLHGTGAASHSFEGVADALTSGFELIIPDLPTHGRTSAPQGWRPTLPAMAQAVAALVRQLDLAPVLLVGHSAGAAIATRTVLDGAVRPAALVSINGAFLPFGGFLAPLFMPLARLCTLSPLLAESLARRAADPAAVQRLLDNTGSTLGDEAVQRYQRELVRPGHVAGTLAMMAHWDLRDLLTDMQHLRVPLHLLVGARDRAVPPRQARQVARSVDDACTLLLPDLGHLAHEENPQHIANELRRIAGHPHIEGSSHQRRQHG
ncbi:MAG: alpha/beta fold hydrolase BchO [Pseudomonadota bacterium]